MSKLNFQPYEYASKANLPEVITPGSLYFCLKEQSLYYDASNNTRYCLAAVPIFITGSNDIGPTLSMTSGDKEINVQIRNGQDVQGKAPKSNPIVIKLDQIAEWTNNKYVYTYQIPTGQKTVQDVAELYIAIPEEATKEEYKALYRINLQLVRDECEIRKTEVKLVFSGDLTSGVETVSIAVWGLNITQ